MEAILKLSIPEIRNLLLKREVRCIEIINVILNNIENSNLNTYITVCGERARKKAREIDQKIERKQNIGVLGGIPIAIKDNISTAGIKTSCGSRILKNYTPLYNATVVRRLEDAGAILIGKTNLDEFAMGSSTETSYFGPTINPWNSEYVPGGSSGGSACAVASEQTIVALGSDTGGSIRQPASFCGCYGLKPTYGRVSRYGLVAFASSLDTIGPIARWVEDIAILLSVISGYDGLDSTSQAIAVPNYYKKLNANIEGMKIGLPKEYFGEGVSEEVKKSVLNAAKILEENGASLEETSLAYTDYAVPVYYIIATSEASSNLARYDGVGYGLRIAQNNLKELYTKTRESGFGKEVKRRIMLGTFCLQAGYKEEYYLKANKVRRLISSDFANAFEGVDAIVTPTSPFPPFKLGEKIQDPISMWLADVFTVAPNLAGLPAISVPCGFVGDLPIGMQLIGKPFDELTILKLAYALQKAGSQN